MPLPIDPLLLAKTSVLAVTPVPDVAMLPLPDVVPVFCKKYVPLTDDEPRVTVVPEL